LSTPLINTSEAAP